MLLAGQNQYWGTVEEATKFWSGFGIEHIMIKRDKDIPLIDQNGSVIEENFERLNRFQNRHGVKYHLHPYKLILEGACIDSSIKDTQLILRGILNGLDEKIHEYDLYPLITIHLPIIDHPDYNFGLYEKTALENSTGFFQNLNLKSRLALENMHDPYRNPGYALLGYKTEHFLKLIGDKDFGLCIDTGHLKIAEEPLENFLQLPYPLYSVHLNGNDGKGDIHQLPTRENIKDFERVIKALKRCEGPVVFEIANHGYSRDEVRECIGFWKGLIK